ncbi:MAG: hypothetical protein ACK4S4_14830 [Pyrinomonadaceae bacterium]
MTWKDFLILEISSQPTLFVLDHELDRSRFLHRGHAAATRSAFAAARLTPNRFPISSNAVVKVDGDTESPAAVATSIRAIAAAVTMDEWDAFFH